MASWACCAKVIVCRLALPLTVRACSMEATRKKRRRLQPARKRQLKRRVHLSPDVVPCGWLGAAQEVLLVRGLSQEIVDTVLGLLGVREQVKRDFEKVVDIVDNLDKACKSGAFFGTKRAVEARCVGANQKKAWRTDSWSLCCVGEASLHTTDGDWVCSTYRRVAQEAGCFAAAVPRSWVRTHSLLRRLESHVCRKIVAKLAAIMRDCTNERSMKVIADWCFSMGIR